MPKFGAAIDAQKIPIKGLVPESAATASSPSSPVDGQLWWDTTTKNLKIWITSGWVQVDNQGVATGAGVSDGDKTEITVSGSGLIWTIDAGVITYAKMAAEQASLLLDRGYATEAEQALRLANALQGYLRSRSAKA